MNRQEAGYAFGSNPCHQLCSSKTVRTSRIAGPLFEQNLIGTRSEAEHAELLLADRVGRVDRLRLTEIGDRIGAAA
jgi:hypothetical protein